MRHCFLAFISLVILPAVSFADAALACKVYNSDSSAQLSTLAPVINGTKQTVLVFSEPVAWYPEVMQFQLVYSSGGAKTGPQTIVANAVSASGVAQTVVMNLEAMQGGVRYGKLQAGDFASDLDSTLKKRKTYDVQCFY